MYVCASTDRHGGVYLKVVQGVRLEKGEDSGYREGQGQGSVRFLPTRSHCPMQKLRPPSGPPEENVVGDGLGAAGAGSCGLWVGH